MKTRLSVILAAVCLALALAPAAQGQSNGAFSSYLVGLWETRLGTGTAILFVNPTLADLDVVVAFFKADGSCIGYIEESLRPNGSKEILVPLDPRLSRVVPSNSFGVIKAISKSRGIAKLGISGYERQCTMGLGCTESHLAAVPHERAGEELSRISAVCHHL